jgi:hypothetical protein
MSRVPQTIEEILVGQMMVYEGCTKEAVIPPPSSCSGTVQAMYGLAGTHLITILIAAVFLFMIFSMSSVAWKLLVTLTDE